VDESALDLDTRRRIYARIRQRPGSYLRELQRDLAMPMGMLEHHLGRLESAGLVTVLQAENKRFFPADMPRVDKRYLALLRQEACRRLVLLLLARAGATRAVLCEGTKLPASTVSYYLAKLVDARLVVVAAEGRAKSYALVDAERAYAILVAHRPTFLDRVLDGFLESFDEVGPATEPSEE
jgi:predicted transcriptional regulator